MQTIPGMFGGNSNWRGPDTNYQTNPNWRDDILFCEYFRDRSEPPDRMDRPDRQSDPGCVG